jgi:high-affinity Fe2+/Pb2+ permease
MSATSRTLARWAIVLGTTLPSAACAAAAVGAAGAAGAIYATTRGVESLINGSVDQVAARVPTVMQQMDISQTGSSTDKTEAKREFKGKHGDLDVTIQLEQQDSAATKAEVSARKNLAEWDKDYARQVMEQLVKQR